MRLPRTDAGMTLTELLVSMILLGVVGTITTAAVVQVQDVYLKAENDSRGLSDVRTVQERMSRDLRQARGVAAGATSSQLRIWIDANSDYVNPADGSEQFIWRVVDLESAPGTGRKQVERVNVGSGAKTVIGRTLVSSAVFTYNAADVAAADVVSVRMQYSAKVGRRTAPKNVDYAIKLRNFE